MVKKFVIIVDKKNRKIGIEEKIKAHKEGLLHRAFSIFIFNSNGEMLLQQRSLNKYHFGGLWSNACCSHPNPNGNIISVAHKRLKQELGFDTKLKKAFSFIYKTKDSKTQLIEHEFDNLFIGFYDKEIKLNRNEINNVRWVKINDLLNEIKKNPKEFTYWFKVAVKELKKRKLLNIKNLKKFILNN